MGEAGKEIVNTFEPSRGKFQRRQSSYRVFTLIPGPFSFSPNRIEFHKMTRRRVGKSLRVDHKIRRKSSSRSCHAYPISIKFTFFHNQFSVKESEI